LIIHYYYFRSLYEYSGVSFGARGVQMVPDHSKMSYKELQEDLKKYFESPYYQGGSCKNL